MTLHNTRALSKTMREQCALQVPLEIKSVSATGRFAGYASVFDLVDSQRDVMMRGAFRDTLKDRLREIKLLWQHAQGEPIGYFTAMFEDAHGLYVEGQLLLDVARAREALALMKQGVVSGLSVGYSPLRYTTDPQEGVRRLHKVALWEVSLVTFPANAASRVSVVKSQPDAREEIALCAALNRAIGVLKN